MLLRDTIRAAREDPEVFRANLSARIAKIYSENIKINAFLGCYFASDPAPPLLDKLIEQKK